MKYLKAIQLQIVGNEELLLRNLKNITDEERKSKDTYVNITEKNTENLKKELY